MSKGIAIIKIDPIRQNVVQMALPAGKKNFLRLMQEKVGARNLQSKILYEVGDVPLCVTADGQASDDTPGWRLRGSKYKTAGVGVLFGQGEKGGLVACPIDVDTVRRLIRWLTAEETQDEGEEV